LEHPLKHTASLNASLEDTTEAGVACLSAQHHLEWPCGVGQQFIDLIM
jgi:hypothetical protein